MQSFRCSINYNDLSRQLQKMQRNTEKVCKNTISDFKKRVPPWVTKEVTKVYAIKKDEIRPSEEGNKIKIGTIHCSGRTIGSFAITYKGKALSPAHFKMKPETPKETGYTLSVEILKGQKKTWGKIKKPSKKQRKNIGRNLTKKGTQNSPQSPKMLMPTGNRQDGGTNYIPFQRVSQNRKDIKALKTLSLPQMIDNEQVHRNIDTTIQTQISKRLEHHMRRYGII